MVREAEGKDGEPSVCAVDAQRVKAFGERAGRWPGHRCREEGRWS